ncbi:MAG TPA: hypothetical protein PLF40_22005 [Kofleriaceae bacterium]|nr:hypothetical protein [Kofleriaceae bacterium]
MSAFFETWKGIADAMGRSERWCRYMARRTANPLPVYKMGGIVRMNESDRNDWLLREQHRPATELPIGGEPVMAPTIVPPALRLIA